MRFAGKRVLVTGAASGIGKATVELFSREGATVVGLDIVKAPDVVCCDVTDPEQARAAVRDSFPLDVVANVAGMVRLSHVGETSLADWQQHLDLNLTAPFVLSQAALPSLLERGGNIVNVASVAGLKGQAYTSAYCASKAGLVMLTKSMALELSKRGVRVNCVCPGGVDTPLVGRVAESLPNDLDWSLMARLDNVIPGFSSPGEIAEAIAYLASDAAASITGTALVIDGGTIS